MLRDYIEQYYPTGRPHQELNGDTPIATQKPGMVNGPTKLISFPVCGTDIRG